MEKKENSNITFYIIIVVWLLLMINMIWSSYKIARLEQNLTELQLDVGTIKQSSNTSTQTENIQAKTFLENEIVKYREDIKEHQEYLISLVTMVGTGILGLFTLFEIKGRKDISKIIREKYTEQFEGEMENFIGGQKKVKFLRNCIKKEAQAKQKKILFLFQKEENKNMEVVYNTLKNQDEKLQISREMISKPILDKEIERWTEEYDIIVYQVSEDEFRKADFEPDENIDYARIAEKCNDNKVYGVLYCENNTALVRSLYNSYYYMNNANYGLTLMERLFNLLYFV